MKLFRASTRHTSAGPRLPRLTVEALEGRAVPATLSIGDATAAEGADAARLVDVPISAPSSPVSTPKSITKGPDGNYYVTSASTHAVLRYDGATLAYLGPFVTPGSGGLDLPVDLVFAAGRLFVADGNNSQVLQYDAATGSSLGAIVPPGAHGIQRPTDLTVHGGDLYIGAWSGDVHRYDLVTGAFIDKFVPTGAGGLVNPAGIQFGPDGNFYVAEFVPNGNDAVLRYNGATGAFMNEFVPAHSGGMSRPAGMKFGPDGNLYVADVDNNNVLRFRGDTGAFIDTFVQGGPVGMDQPTRLMFSGNRMLVTSQNNNKVMRFDDPPWEVFNVTLSDPASGPVSVQYTTADNTASAGSNYVAASGTLTFAPGETSKTVFVRTLDDHISGPTKAFFVNLSNPVGATIARGQAVGTILDNDPLQVSSAKVTGGAIQRSRVTDITVTFTGLATLPANPVDAFRLTRIGPDGSPADVTLAVDLTSSTATQTIARLTFSGGLTEFGSIVDGLYRLTVLAAQVSGAGQPLDGDANGIAGGDFTLDLHRLYGDINGDKAVNGLDLTELRKAFGASAADANYRADLDFNGDGAINGTDLAQFRSRFGVILP